MCNYWLGVCVCGVCGVMCVCVVCVCGVCVCVFGVYVCVCCVWCDVCVVCVCVWCVCGVFFIIINIQHYTVTLHALQLNSHIMVTYIYNLCTISSFL
jgi:hypothetical protein